MKTHLFLIVLTGIFSTLSLAAQEKAEKRPGTTNFPFWTTKKRGETPQFVPGLNAVLELTSAQQEQIDTARNEMANDEAVKTARSISKNDPSATQEQRDKARAVVEAANAKLHARVASILTSDQTALIVKINGAYQDTLDEIGTVYEEKYAAVKNDDAARRRLQDEKNQDVDDHFLHKLDTLLTPAQRDAMTRAAEDEQRHNTASTKKPSK
jgi:hypothetical protein